MHHTLAFGVAGRVIAISPATYTNGTGHVQAAARVIQPPGDAGEDWQILMKVGLVFGVNLGYASGVAVREAIAAELAHIPAYSALPAVTFARPISARHWLQSSNPSERWKWDFMFQDLPPVKGDLDPTALPAAPGIIALREVK